MDDARRAIFEDQQADIVELEHIATTPFRWLLSLLKWVTVLFFLALWTLGSWIFGIFGGNSMARRQAQADRIYQVTQAYAHHSSDEDFAVEHLQYARRGQPFQYSPDGPVQPADYSWSEMVNHPAHDGKGYVAGVLAERASSATAGPGVCQSGLDYDIRLGEWETRGPDALRRKTARMTLAYEDGVIMISSLRRVLTIMKLTDGHPNLTADSPIFQPGNLQSLCNADPWVPGMTEEAYNKQVETSESIQLYPMTTTVMIYHGRIVGMCDYCDSGEDLTYQVNWLADLFSADPYVTHGQKIAIEMLESMGDENVWVHAAHKNGINDDAEIIRLNHLAKQYRDRVMFPGGKPPYYINYE